MKFAEFTVNTDSDKTELVAYFVQKATNSGVTILDANDIPENIEYIDGDTLNKLAVCQVKGYCSPLKVLSIIKKVEKEYFSAFGVYPEITQVMKDDKNYLSEYKKWEKPVKIGEIYISPTPIKENCVVIDSVLAFGNGQHETTALCVEILQEISCKDKTVLDVGCGSGVLGFVAEKMGAKSLYACDYDKESVAATKHNAQINGINCKIAQGNLTKGITQTFDIVVANITAKILLPNSADFYRVTDKKGHLILSGMLNFQVQSIVDAYSVYFDLQNRYDNGEWSALLFRPKNK